MLVFKLSFLLHEYPWDAKRTGSILHCEWEPSLNNAWVSCLSTCRGACLSLWSTVSGSHLFPAQHFPQCYSKSFSLWVLESLYVTAFSSSSLCSIVFPFNATDSLNHLPDRNWTKISTVIFLIFKWLSPLKSWGFPKSAQVPKVLKVVFPSVS